MRPEFGEGQLVRASTLAAGDIVEAYGGIRKIHRIFDRRFELRLIKSDGRLENKGKNHLYIGINSSEWVRLLERPKTKLK